MIEVYDDDGNEITIPKKFDVCPRCESTGKHTNPSIDGNGIGQEEFDEDPDFFEDYMGGVYDVTCYECNGLRVVEVPDWDRLTGADKKAYREACQEENDFNAMCAAERRMGA